MMIAFFNYVYHSPPSSSFLILFSSSSKSSNAAYLRGKKKWTEWSQKILRLVLYNVHIDDPNFSSTVVALYTIAFSRSHKTRSETFEPSFSLDVSFNQLSAFNFSLSQVFY